MNAIDPVGLLVLSEADGDLFAPGLPGHDLVVDLQEAIKRAMRASSMPCSVAQTALTIAAQHLAIAEGFVAAALDGARAP